jgi:hypothetical protein
MSVNSNPNKHFHADEQGLLRACYHKCRTSALSWGFWIGLTIGFPFEHLLWEKVWPFKEITKALGL